VYLKTGDFERFKSQFMRGNVSKEIRYTLEMSDDINDVHRSVIEFYTDFQAHINNLQDLNPNNIPKLIELQNLVETELHIDVDNT
jgi:hypothetical protein